ncbi:hypothetical protein Patl1_26182 [Pistacia atlantica]|uniref:Uncharacterized protein n=1 Tax=Pistacia atlantica TaxID=434234 RepID=A0ACC1B336_9ROSI|nr:hypothetical protein Patl1_26182 [Pistacia atlantica]
MTSSLSFVLLLRTYFPSKHMISAVWITLDLESCLSTKFISMFSFFICEIQLKSPNWLFGQRKLEGSVSAAKVTSHEIVNREVHNEIKANSFYDLNWLSSVDDINEEDVFQRYLTMASADEANGWYGGTTVVMKTNAVRYINIILNYANSYSQLLELRGPTMEPFQNDHQGEMDYSHVLEMNRLDVVDKDVVEAEMEAVLKEYDQIGADLWIIPTSCKLSRLSRWIIGEEKRQKV